MMRPSRLQLALRLLGSVAVGATFGCASLFGDCGPGTVKDDGGTCVVDRDALLPDVASVMLTRLHIDGDGLRPLMVLHEAEVELELAIEGEAFQTNVVVGLTSADGKASCTLGYVEVEHARSTDAATSGDMPESFAGTAIVGKTLVVQEPCAALIGEGAQAWVAFDPFQHTHWAGRKGADILDEDGKLDMSKDAAVAKLLAASQLPLAGCAAGEGSVHPESCETALTIRANTGRDVQLTRMQPTSSVAIVEWMASAPKPTAKYDPTPYLPDLSETPQVTVSSEVQLFGEAADPSDGQTTQDEVELSFSIRPSGVSSAKWMPLAERYVESMPTKGGGTSSVLRELEQYLLGSLTEQTVFSKTTPLYLTPVGRDRVLTGDWANHLQFDLRACAQAPFAENGPQDDPLGNNCRTTSLVLLRRERSFTGLPPTAAAILPSGLVDLGAENVEQLGDVYEFGDRKAVGVQAGMGAYRRWFADSETMRIGVFRHASLQGWFPFVLEDVGLWLDVAHEATDVLTGELTLNGIELPVPKVEMPETWEQNKEAIKNYNNKTKVPALDPTKSQQVAAAKDAQNKTKRWEKSRNFPIYGPLVATVVIALEFRVSLNFGVGKSSKPAAFGPEECDLFDSEWQACFLATPEVLPFLGAQRYCGSLGAHLPSDRQDKNVGPKIAAKLGALVAERSQTPFQQFWTNIWHPPGEALSPTNPLKNIVHHHLPEPPSTWPLTWSDDVSTAAEHAEWGSGGTLISKADPDYATQLQLSKSAATAVQGTQHLNSFWVPMNRSLPVVCEFAAGPTDKSIMEQSEFYLRVQPTASLTATGYGGLGLAAIRGGGYLELDVMELEVPVDVGLRWRTGHPYGDVSGDAFLRIGMALRALSGELGGWFEWYNPLIFDWAGKKHTLSLTKWKGITLLEQTLAEHKFAPWKIAGPGPK